MSLFRCTVRRLCGSTGPFLVNSVASSSRMPPHNLKLSHVLGTRQFSLFGVSMNHSKLLVQCTLSSPFYKRDSRSRAVRRRGKVNVLGSIEFECQLSNICRGFPLVLGLSCATRGGLLVINGAIFSPVGTTVLEGPELASSQFTYQGPHMNQSHLAEVAIGRRLHRSPLDDIAHIEAAFFSTTDCFGSSSRTWFGHTPVHTVKPELVDSIAKLVGAFGIDDTLAEYVEWKARAVDKAERDAWINISNILLPNLEKL
ncbi:hypothetical protein Q4I30_003637 [Leishmania utingensis]|uniref:Mitochondrial glycoprotein n=1 Tax=Leishmania utingensis TaxID=653362 RepID=A0AAW3AHQ5_9TRYP